MPMRSFFKRSVAFEPVEADNEFRNAAIVGANTENENPQEEVQLADITDNGVFVPPPPRAHKPGFWQTRSNSSLASSNHRSIFSDAEPFNMSRESFDSYRRSFDISARSPIAFSETDSFPRHSLDSSLFLSTHDQKKEDLSTDSCDEESKEVSTFEDVKLTEEGNKKIAEPVNKRRGLFARLGLDNDVETSKASGGHHFFSGRKRTQSGQGNELRSISIEEMPQVMVTEA